MVVSFPCSTIETWIKTYLISYLLIPAPNSHEPTVQPPATVFTVLFRIAPLAKGGKKERKKNPKRKEKAKKKGGKVGNHQVPQNLASTSTPPPPPSFLPLPPALLAATCAVRAPSSPRPRCRSTTGDGAAALVAAASAEFGGSPNTASNRLRPGATESGITLCRLAWHSREEGGGTQQVRKF